MQTLRLTRRQSREVDRIAIEEYGVPGILLMENAARGVADAVDELRAARQLEQNCVIFCGKGNNGGDGLAAARHLYSRGYRVLIVLCDPPEAFKGDALLNFKIVTAMNLPMKPLEAFDGHEFGVYWMAIDAIYGTGYRPPARPDLGKIRNIVRNQMARVVAADLPSGLDADTGEFDPANIFDADVTVTFAAEKACFAAKAARRVIGEIVVADIGLPRELIERAANGPG